MFLTTFVHRFAGACESDLQYQESLYQTHISGNAIKLTSLETLWGPALKNRSSEDTTTTFSPSCCLCMSHGRFPFGSASFCKAPWTLRLSNPLHFTHGWTRPSEQARVRASERSKERGSERASEPRSERPSECVSEGASERAIERARL